MISFKKFLWRRWGSSLPGLRTFDPPLSPPLTQAEICWRMLKILSPFQAILCTFFKKIKKKIGDPPYPPK